MLFFFFHRKTCIFFFFFFLFLDAIKKVSAYFFPPVNGPQNIRFDNKKAGINLVLFSSQKFLVNKLRNTFQTRAEKATVST